MCCYSAKQIRNRNEVLVAIESGNNNYECLQSFGLNKDDGKRDWIGHCVENNRRLVSSSKCEVARKL